MDIVQTPYRVNPLLVRGLDYYTNTAFEVIAPGIGAQSAVGGGGRYDGLVEEIGGPSVPGIGFGLGLERILLLLKGPLPTATRSNGIFLATSDVAFLLFITPSTAQEGLMVEMDYLNGSLKSQLKFADKGFRFNFLGEEERIAQSF